MARNPIWSRDELILALDLYQRVPFTKVTPSSPEAVELSKVLNHLAIHTHGTDDLFRNPNGVCMKLGNFARLDPAWTSGGRSGLPHGSEGEEVVWRDFAHDPARLRAVADAIRRNVTQPADEPTSPVVDDDLEAPEGAILLRSHVVRERNASLVNKRKQLELKNTGVLRCEVCAMHFADVYGTVGQGFIECHHIVPLASVTTRKITRLSDLALVCSNCHRMLHRGGDLLTISALRSAVAERRINS